MERFIRYKTAEKISWGIFGEDNIAEITGNPAVGYEKTGNYYDLSQIILLAPVEPSKMYIIYKKY